MNTAAIRANRRRLLILTIIVLFCAAAYMLVEVDFSNPRLFAYAMKLRAPKLIVMLITAFSIGGASLVFQSIINNTIVTPCLLGMNSLYTLIHTAVVFFLGSASAAASNANLSFAVDVVLMGITATIIYSWIFKKTKHNVLYVLLVGTVLTSFFSSIQTTLTRVMDPNEYDNLLNTLVASFSNINSEIIVFSLILLASVIFALRKELALLDVLTLGKEQAINLVGTDIYEKLVKHYTEKQWGRPCTELPAFIIKRLPVRLIFDNNYFNALYQGIPNGGYTQMVANMLQGVEVRLGVNYLANKAELDALADRVIYTGPIDAYFDYSLGTLQYRSVRFETETLACPNYQGNAVINYTDAETPYTRIIEHKHFEFGSTEPGTKTVISREYSAEWKPGDEPYYPVNDDKNSALYAKYKALADAEPHVVFGGRLGEYKYYDMDKVIESALACVAVQMDKINQYKA